MTASVAELVLWAFKAAALLGAAGMAAVVLRRSPARLRALTWTAAVAGVLLLPAVASVLPSLEIELPLVSDLAVRSSAATLRPPIDSDRDSHATVDNSSDVTSRPDASTGSHQQVRDRARPLITSQRLLLIGWLTGVVVVLVRMAAGWLRMVRIVRRAQPIDDPHWLRSLRRASRLAGCRRSVRLLCSVDLEIPATAGFIRPVVVVPRRALGWLTERREVVLIHELVHVARLDWVARVAAAVACSLHWFDPLVWLASWRLGRDQERACDERVLASGVRPSSYAAHLLEIARGATPRSLVAVPALELARHNHVEERIMHILAELKPSRSAVVVGLPAMLVVMSLVPAIAAVRPTPPDAQPPPTSPTEISSTVAPPATPAAVAPSADRSEPAPPAPPAAEEPPSRPAEPELVRAVEELHELERQLVPHTRAIEEAVRAGLEDRLHEIEEIRIEIDEQKMAEIEARMEDELAKLEVVHELAEPLAREMETLAHSMAELRLEDLADAEGLAEAQRERLQELEVEMESLHVEMEDLHLALEPLHDELADLHVAIEPHREEIERLQADLEPLHEQLERLHEQLEPIEGELHRASERVHRAVEREVETALRETMGPVVDAGAPLDEAAVRVVSESRIQVDDGVLRMQARSGEVRVILDDLLRPHRRGNEDEFDAALAWAVAELSDLTRTLR